MITTTFYSYKGGLGRSLLLAWSARQLALNNGSAVALDLDLEAPGLSYKLGFGSDAELGPGVVDLIHRFQRGDSPPSSLKNWLRAVPGFERLWLLPAGPRDAANYLRSLASISWEGLFHGHDPQGVRFFVWLKESLASDPAPDHLLVDARTGITEMGGAALALLADQVLALVGTSEEGISGTRDVLRGVVSFARAVGVEPPRMGLVLARMPAALASVELQRLRATVRDTIEVPCDDLSLSLHVGFPIVVRSEPGLQVDEKSVLQTADLRVHSDYADVIRWLQGESVSTKVPEALIGVDDSIETIRASIRLQHELLGRDRDRYLPEFVASLDNLASALANEGRLEQSWAVAREATELRRELVRMQPQVFKPTLATSLHNLGLRLANIGRLEEALHTIEEAMVLFRELSHTQPDVFKPDLARTLRNLGNAYAALGETRRAIEHHEQALVISRATGDRRGEGATLGNLGTAYARLGETGRAIELYNQSLAIGREISDPWIINACEKGLKRCHGDTAPPGGAD